MARSGNASMDIGQCHDNLCTSQDHPARRSQSPAIINSHRFIPKFDPLLTWLQVRGIVELEFSFAEVF